MLLCAPARGGLLGLRAGFEVYSNPKGPRSQIIRLFTIILIVLEP